jgi:hypothetical protein
MSRGYQQAVHRRQEITLSTEMVRNLLPPKRNAKKRISGKSNPGQQIDKNLMFIGISWDEAEGCCRGRCKML